MAHPSSVSTAVFVAIVVTVATLFFGAWRRAGGGAVVPILVLLGWLVLPAVLAATGRLDVWDRRPPPAMMMMAAITVGTVILAFSPAGGRLASGVPLAGLVGYQFFRVAVEWVLHRLAVEQVIPV